MWDDEPAFEEERRPMPQQQGKQKFHHKPNRGSMFENDRKKTEKHPDFKGEIDVPTRELYYGLCREYSKSLGVIMLKKWAVDEEYIEVIRHTGNWHERVCAEVQLTDLVNLSLYHAIKEMNPQAQLPPLQSLAAYEKLLPPLNFISDNGELTLLVSHQAEIHAIAAALR